jgi:hypothetical protein
VEPHPFCTVFSDELGNDHSDAVLPVEEEERLGILD